MAASVTQAEIQNQLRALATGIASVALADPWVLSGTSYTKAQLAQLLQASITATDAAIAAKAAATQAISAAKTQRTQALKLRKLVLAYIEVALGDSTPVIAQLGYASAPTAMTVVAKLAAVDKAKATRTARHTMGSKQKAAISGVATPATETPATIPAVVATAATPKVGS